MECMKQLFSWIKREETGQGMVEYALIVALVALVAIVGLKVLGPKVNNMYVNVGNKIK